MNNADMAKKTKEIRKEGNRGRNRSKKKWMEVIKEDMSAVAHIIMYTL